MKLQIKDDTQSDVPAPAANGASAKATDKASDGKRYAAVWVVVVLGLTLTVAAFLNLQMAEKAILVSHSKGEPPQFQRTSWVVFASGVFFTVIIAVFLRSVLRRNLEIELQLEAETHRRQHEQENRRRMEVDIARQRNDLDRRVQERTRELADSNKFLLTEIADRKQAQAELASEKERLMTTLRSIGDGVIAVDSNSRVVLMNRVGEQLTGWSQEEALRKHLYNVFKVSDEETGEEYTEILERVMAGGAQESGAKCLILASKEGQERPITHSSAPIFDVDGKINGVVIAFRDITEQRRTENERMKAHRLESIALLAGGIAHDYNNLLTAVLGNLSLAQMALTETPDELPGLLNEVENASLRAKELTRQLLTFSKGGAPVRTAASLTEIIRDSAEFVLRGSMSRCEIKLADDTWPANVDLGQISQVIQNLVINADQAMADGGRITLQTENIAISAENKTLGLKPGRYVKITVADTGPGMSADVLSRIFEPYFTTKEKGSGLGLTTSFSIVKKHDGLMTVESKIGSGTTFFIYLPAVELEAAPTLGKGQPLVLRGNGRILVMDDEASIRTLVKRMLESVGYHVVTVKDGQETLKQYQEALAKGQPFDAVMLDLTVAGGMGGRETMRQLLAKHPDVKAIVSSGYANDPVMEKYRKYGFIGMVMKPYTLGELTYTLKRALG